MKLGEGGSMLKFGYVNLGSTVCTLETVNQVWFFTILFFQNQEKYLRGEREKQVA